MNSLSHHKKSSENLRIFKTQYDAIRCDAIKKMSTEWDAIFREIMQCANSVTF